MAKTIEDGGYGARRDDIRLTLTGVLSKEGESFVLTLGDVKPGPQAFLLSGEVALLEPLTGKPVQLDGLWKPGKKGERAQLQVRKAVAETESTR